MRPGRRTQMKLIVSLHNFATSPTNVQCVCLCGLHLLLADQRDDVTQILFTTLTTLLQLWPLDYLHVRWRHEQQRDMSHKTRRSWFHVSWEGFLWRKPGWPCGIFFRRSVANRSGLLGAFSFDGVQLTGQACRKILLWQSNYPTRMGGGGSFDGV
jgi:hypothetical protein